MASLNFGDIITFTRASSAGRFNSSGLYEQVASNIPRLDYDPVTLQARGLLIEEQRTNLARWSRDLTNAAWGKTNVTASLTATGIDGAANSATVLTAGAGNGIVLQSITSASAARATTAYVKRRTGTGVVEMTQDGGTTWAPITINSTSYTRAGPASATVTNPQIGFRLATSGDQIDVDMVQCESGSFSTSAITTTSSQVTRAADIASVNTLSPWYNASEGTLFVDYTRSTTSATGVTQLWDGTTNNRIGLLAIGASDVARIIAGSATQMDITAAGFGGKSAIAYKSNDSAFSRNGSTAVTDSSVIIPTVNALTIGSSIGSTLTGHIRAIRYYPRRLSNAELQAMTT